MKSFVCTVFLLFLLSWGQAQKLQTNYNPAMPNGQSKDFFPVSPNAASLGIYGQVPVSLYTGTPNVTIPLYTVKYKDLEVPIAINYNASGNKPDAVPGPVGQGWSLQAGGVITRVVNGLPDFFDFAGVGNVTTRVAYNLTAEPNWSDDATMLDYLKQPYVCVNDQSDPDEFYFNFNGITGKFYLNNSGHFTVKSANNSFYTVDLQIITGQKYFLLPSLAGTMKSPDFYQGVPPSKYIDTLWRSNVIYKFVLTDSKGIKYTFGGTDESIEFTRPGLSVDGPFVVVNMLVTPSAWNLTSIESPNGYKIDFKYDRGYLVTKSAFSDMFEAVINKTGGATIARANPRLKGFKSNLFNTSNISKIISPTDSVSFLNSVASSQLWFEPDSVLDTPLPFTFKNEYRFIWYKDVSYADIERMRPWKVDGIEVMDKSGNRLKRMNFAYTSSDTTRLKLTYLTSFGLTSTGPYSQYAFQYNNIPLPPYLSYKTDHFGFYNGRRSLFDNLIAHPNFAHFDSAAYATSKEPDTTIVQAEILKRITYPTGGYTELEYEPNYYGTIATSWPFSTKYAGGNKVTSGVRIKSIVSFDNPGSQASIKRYYYNRNYLFGGDTCSGVLAYQPAYYEYLSGPVAAPAHIPPGGASVFSGTLVYYKHWSCNPIYSLGFTRGNHVSYSEVTEVNADGSASVYRYKNFDNGYSDRPLINQLSDHTAIKEFYREEEGSAMDLERGQLLSEELYDASHVLKKRTFNYYNNDINRFNENVPFLRLSNNSVSSADIDMPSYRIIAGQHYTYLPFLKKIHTTEFEGVDSITNIIENEYDPKYRLLTKQRTTASDGRVLTTVNHYPNDMVDSGFVTPYASMVGRNMLDYLVEREQWSGSNKLTKNITSYSKGLASDTSLILQASLKTKFKTRPEEIRMNYLQYDNIGNPLTISQPNGVKVCLVWSYNKAYVVAKIVNADYNTVLGALGGTTAVGAFALQFPSKNEVENFLQPLRTSSTLSGAMVTTYAYQPGIGIINQTEPNGISSSYEYDNLGRLSVIRDNDGKIVKRYCYNYAGQIEDCSIVINNWSSKRFLFTADKNVFCSRNNAAVQNILAYYQTEDDADSEDSSINLMQRVYFKDRSLSIPLATGYYTSTGLLPLHPLYTYVEDGRVIFMAGCSGEPPVFKYSDTVLADFCAQPLPSVAAMVRDPDNIIVGDTLWPAPPYLIQEGGGTLFRNGYYIFNNKVYHVSGGIVDTVKTCSSYGPVNSIALGDLPPPRFPILGLLYTAYYRGDTEIGTVFYTDEQLTTFFQAGQFADGVYVYTVDSNGTITHIDPYPY